MPKVVPPTGLKEVSVTDKTGRTKIYKADKSGMINVSESVAKELRKEGIPEASLTGSIRAKGYPCLECGFSSWFTKCSRCGKENSEIMTDGGVNV